MTPKIVVILDKATLKTDVFRYDDPGPLPPLINPERPNEVKDGPGRAVPADDVDNEKPS